MSLHNNNNNNNKQIFITLINKNFFLLILILWLAIERIHHLSQILGYVALIPRSTHSRQGLALWNENRLLQTFFIYFPCLRTCFLNQ